jgi:hypothetical protein
MTTTGHTEATEGRESVNLFEPRAVDSDSRAS